MQVNKLAYWETTNVAWLLVGSFDSHGLPWGGTDKPCILSLSPHGQISHLYGLILLSALCWYWNGYITVKMFYFNTTFSYILLLHYKILLILQSLCISYLILRTTVVDCRDPMFNSYQINRGFIWKYFLVNKYFFCSIHRWRSSEVTNTQSILIEGSKSLFNSLNAILNAVIWLLSNGTCF